MGWSLRKTLYASAFPAAIFFVGWVSRDLERRGADESAIDVILPIAIIILVLWLAVSVFLWLVSKLFRKRAKQDQ